MFVNIGFGNQVNQSRITAIMPKRHGNYPESNRLATLHDEGLVLNLTNGRKAQSIITLDTGHRVLSAIHPEEIQERIQ